VALTFAAGVALAQGVAPLDRAGFVCVQGRRFVVDGRPFRFVGTNAAIMHGAARRASAEAALDAIAHDGMRVVRIWALGEHAADGVTWAEDYAFRMGPDVWVERSFVHLDRVLAAARARGLRVIVVLANRWGDYGGVPRYVAWAGLTDATPEAMLARFFTDATVVTRYQQHLDRVLRRVNTVTAVPYRDDPTIFAWELINESDAPDGVPGARASLVAWTRAMASYVHALCPRHLVAAGHIGYTRRAQRDTWLALQRLREIDYADAHAYPTHYDTVRSPAELDDYIDDHVQLAHYVAEKPFVWGELGFTTTRSTVLGRPRRWWFERFFARSERDGVDGLLAWTYSTSVDVPHDHGIFFDAPRAARTRDVRSVYARYAARWRDDVVLSANPRLQPAQGERPLWQTRRRRVGPEALDARPRPGGGARWSIAPERYAFVDSEAAGRWDEYALTQVYARGPSAFTWALRVTATSRAAALHATAVRVRLRASSELPGRGEHATPGDGSLARLTLDGVLLGEVALRPDDGLGAWVEATTRDPAALAVLQRVGRHLLSIDVQGPNGVCVYGGATGRIPVPDNAGVLPGRVELSVLNDDDHEVHR
jgi:mannan endo-1,4-beta-mannosidase